MVDFVKSCLQDYFLFSLWEGIIFYLFVKYIGDIKIKRIDLFFIGLLFCVTNFLLMPIIRQFVCVVLILLFLFLVRNNSFINSLKWIIFEYFMVAITEMSIFFICNKIIKLDLSYCKTSILFFVTILIKFIQIIILMIWRKVKMKQLIGGVVRK